MQTVQKTYMDAAHAASLASSWVERNQAVAVELQDSAPEFLVKLGDTAIRLGYSLQNLSCRPTIGLFGASQAGKSYLVSSLAAGTEGVLATHWDQDEINFIKHVNPAGNNSEATGFATRFSHERHPCPAGFPVELKVFGELELVMILINSFFADINQSDVKVPNNEEFYLQHLQKCEQFVDQKAAQDFKAYPDQLLRAGVVVPAAGVSAAVGAANSGLSTLNLAGIAGYAQFSAGRVVNVGGKSENNYIYPEHVLELAEYVVANSAGKLGTFDSMKTFWLRLSRMLPFMTLEGRVQTLSVFWQNIAIFNETYRRLASELLKLKGHDTVFAPKEAFVMPSADGRGLVQNDSGTIMHITKLSTMFKDNTTLTCALLRPDTFDPEDDEMVVEAQVNLNMSCLAALALELRFNLEGSGNLDNFDVLDLPGARSRDVVLLKDVIDDCANYRVGTPLNENMQMRGSEFFRRGKVGYLFERYARRNEIEQLLFCIGVNAQQDVTTVLTILSDWIEKNVGDTPQARAQSPNPLTIVLTRYDEVFNRQLRNLQNGLPLDMNQELNIALNRIQKLNWFNQWTPNQPFSRILLARKPNLGDINPWITFDPATKKELGIEAASAPLIQQIREQLLQVPEFKEHISNFAEALDQVLSLNNGGVSNIARTIAGAALSDKERVSVRTYKAISCLRDCVSQLAPFATRDSAIAMEKIKGESKALSLGLLQCNRLSPCFDLLRLQLEIAPERLEEIYQIGFAAGSNVKRFVQAVCQEYLNKLTELSRQSNTEIKAIAELVARAYQTQQENIVADENNVQNFSLCYMEQEGRFKTKEEFQDDVVLLFNRFYSEVYKTFSAPQLNVRSYMEQVLREQENINESFSEIMRVQVQLMSNILSDFNLYLGVHLLPNSATRAALNAQKSDDFAANKQALGMGAASAANAASGFGGAASGFGPAASVAAQAAAPAPAAAAVSYGDEDELEDDYSDLDDENSYEAVASPDATAGAGGAAAAAATPVAPASAAVQSALSAMGAGAGAGAGHSRQPPAPVLHAGQSLLGTTEGPLNHFVRHDNNVSYVEQGTQVAFAPICGADDTGLLPHLEDADIGYEFKFISDYMSTLMFMMCQINVFVENKYHFATNENLLLCQMLNTMETCLHAGNR